MLPNGLSYYVRRNPKPARRCALALAVRVGSLTECEAERGVAHFLEHLAFSATERFSHHSLVAFLEAAGLSFGACQNAYTTADETVFQFLLPTDGAEGLLQQALAILAEFATRIRVAPQDVEAERGAILEEWRGGRDAQGRAAEAHWRLLHQGSLYADRLPIGLESVIREVTATTVRGFLAKWYRPEHMCICAVGDWAESQDSAAVVEAIREAFSGCTPPVDAPHPPPPLPCAAFVPHACARVLSYVDRELSASSVQLSFGKALGRFATPAQLRSGYILDLFTMALSSRLFKLSRTASPPFYSASAGVEEACAVTQLTVLSASAPVGGCLAALEALLMELARVRLHGLSTRELLVARSNLEADIETAFVERDQAQSTALRDEYLRHFMHGEAVVDAELEARLGRSLLRSIRDEEVAALAHGLRACDSCVVKAACGANDKRPPTEADLLAVLARVEALEAAGGVPPADFLAAPEALMASLPELGPDAVILHRRHWPSLDVTELTLSNGMRVALKRTSLLDDQVLLSATAHGGLSQLPPGKPYLSAACASLLAAEAGPFGHRPEVLEDILAGKRCGITPTLHAFRRCFSGDQSPADLGDALALVHLLFTTAVDAEPETLAVALRLTRERIRAQKRDAMFRFSSAVKALNYGNCYYTEPMSERMLGLVSPANALAFFDGAFRNPAEFTVCLVGALDEEAALPIVLRYLGSIPKVSQPAPLQPCDVKSLAWSFPALPVRREVRVVMEEAQAVVQVTWPLRVALRPACDAQSEAAIIYQDNLWARLACRVLESRLLKVLRFKSGMVYSVSAASFFGMEGPATTPPFRGDCAVSFACDPQAAWALADASIEELAALQAEGPNAEEVTTAAELERREWELSQDSNAFWLDQVVAGYQVRRLWHIACSALLRCALLGLACPKRMMRNLMRLA